MMSNKAAIDSKAVREIGDILADGYPDKNKELVAREIATIVEIVLPALADRASKLLAQGKDKVEEVWQVIKEGSEDLFVPALKEMERARVIYVASKFMNNRLIGTLITTEAVALARKKKEG